MIDFAKLAADTTVAATPEFPPVTMPRRAAADPNLVRLITEARDGKRRDLPGRFTTTPHPGKKGANESQDVVNALNRAAREVGVKIRTRRFDADATGVRITFAVVDSPAAAKAQSIQATRAKGTK